MLSFFFSCFMATYLNDRIFCTCWNKFHLCLKTCDYPRTDNHLLGSCRISTGPHSSMQMVTVCLHSELTLIPSNERLGEPEERPSGAFLTLKPVKQNQVAISYYLTLKRPTQVVFWYLHEGLRFPPWEQRAVETRGWAQSRLLWAVRTQPSMPQASASHL